MVIYNEIWTKTKHDRIQFVPFDEQHKFINNIQSQAATREFKRYSSIAEEVISSLAYDWITDKIYIAVEQTTSLFNLARIEVCPISAATLISKETSLSRIAGDDNSCAVLLHRNLDSMHYLVLDPIDGFIFYK